MKTGCAVCLCASERSGAEPGAWRFTALHLKSRYWEIIRLNLVKRSVKLRSPRRATEIPEKQWGNSSEPAICCITHESSQRGRGRGLCLKRGPFKKSPEALRRQVAPQLATGAALRSCEWAGSPLMEQRVTRRVEDGQALPRGRWWLDCSRAVRCKRGWPLQEPFELLTAGGMCLVSVFLPTLPRHPA